MHLVDLMVDELVNLLALDEEEHVAIKNIQKQLPANRSCKLPIEEPTQNSGSGHFICSFYQISLLKKITPKISLGSFEHTSKKKMTENSLPGNWANAPVLGW